MAVSYLKAWQTRSQIRALGRKIRRQRRRLQWRRAERWQTLLGAVVGFLALAGVNGCSDYATRREKSLSVQRQCQAVTQNLITETKLLREGLGALVTTLQKPQLHAAGDFILFLPLDEDLHEQQANFYLLDSGSIDAVLRTIHYYRLLREVMSESKATHNLSSAFIIDRSQDRTGYIEIAHLIDVQAASAIRLLGVSHACKKLGRTALLP